MKLAELQTKLLPHQERVRDRMAEEGRTGLVAVHGLGSGKTLSAISVQDRLGTPATVVVPAALKENYRKEQRKHVLGTPSPTQLETIQAAASRGGATANPLLIVDEAHKLRDPSTASYKAVAGTQADKKLFLTASPFYNHPADLSALVNLASRKKLLPEDREGFESNYITHESVKPGLLQRWRGVSGGEVPHLNKQRAQELGDIYSKWVDYHAGSTENFPSVERRTVDVQLHKDQKDLYDTLMSKAPSWVSAKVKSGLPPSRQELATLSTFLNGPRQVSVSNAEFVKDPALVRSPKIDKAFENLQAMLGSSERAKAVIYSNYLGSGISPYKKKLEEAGIAHGEFTGKLSPKDRDQMVRDYNEGKIRALLLSSAGGEGLDLKGTRLVQLLDPHWNQEKLKQVEGRAIRYKSHEGLPPEERKVLVEQYLAHLEPKEREGVWGRLLGKTKGSRAVGADEYLYNMSQDKERLLDEFRGLLKPGKAMPAVPTTSAQAVSSKTASLTQMPFAPRR